MTIRGKKEESCTRLTTLCLVLTQVTHVHLFHVLAVVFAVILTFAFCNTNPHVIHINVVVKKMKFISVFKLVLLRF